MPRANILGAPAPTRPLESPPSPHRLPPKPKPVERPRKWLWILAALVLLAALAAGWWLFRRQAVRARTRPGGVPFRTAKVRKAAVAQVLRVTGITSANRYVTLLSPQMQGSRRSHGRSHFDLTLQEIAPSGMPVKKGDVVARFDQQNMINRLDDYRAWMLQHENNLKRLKALLQVTRVNYEQQILAAKARMEKAALDLKTIPIVSAIQAEKLRLNHEEMTSRYKMLSTNMKHFMVSERSAILRSEIDLRQTRMELDRAERNAQKMIVQAPLDGITVMMTTHRGHENVQISAGDQLGSNQPFMRIVDTRSMLVTARVNQVDAQSVHMGMPARIHFDAYPDLELPAHVVNVGSFAQGTGWRASWVRAVPITLKIDDLDQRVIPDLSVSADLKLASAPVSPVAPRECLFNAPGEEQPFVFVRHRDGWEKRPVETGLQNHVEVAVTSGLSEGEVLAAEWPSGVQQATQ